MVPACLITDAEGKRAIVSSDPYSQERGWVVRSATVNVTRIWSASTATFFLTTRVPELSQPPPSIPPELGIEQQIAIYLGYLGELRPPNLEDAQANRLIRVFIGVVDTVTAACTGRVGYSVKVQCRDRIKWFMESALTFNLTKDDLISAGQEMDVAGAPGGKATGISRPAVIWFIMNSAIGRSATSEQICNQGQEGTLCRPCLGCGVNLRLEKVYNGAGGEDGSGPQAFYGKPDGIMGRTSNAQATSPTQVGVYIYTSRLEFGQETASSFLLTDPSALLTIKSLSYQEAFPTEFFQDPHTGRLIYGPWGIDLTGLDDQKRFQRLYFVRNVPDGMEVYSPNQMALNYKEELSSLGMRTNIVVGAPQGDGSGNHVVHLHARAHEIARTPIACRYAVVEDPTLTSSAESLLVAIAYSREASRSLKSAQITLIGDPSLSLGEVIQVISSPLRFKGRELRAAESEREAIRAWDKQAAAYFNRIHQVLEAAKTDPNSTEAASSIEYPGGSRVTSSGREKVQTDIHCNPEYIITSPDGESYHRPLDTIWRVQSVVHHFKSSGYVTEALLVSPY